MHAKDLMVTFGASDYSFRENVEGISHEESITPPKDEGNTVNWIVGHMLHARQSVLLTAQVKPAVSQDELQMYSNTGEFDPANARPFDQLVQEMADSFSKMTRAILRLSDDALTEELPDPFLGQTVTRGQMLNLLLFHEAYHGGQIGILRRTMGKPGKIGPQKKR